jgi:hypothetical protein
MKRRGRKSLFTPQLQKRICDFLADANTIKTACDACGIGERTYFNFCERYPAFLAATREAMARAKIQLVAIVRNAAKTNAKHAEWLLERSWPNEYARTERVEQIGEKADEKKNSGVTILYQGGNLSLAELLSFPIHSSMKQETDSPEVAREKQARLLGQTAQKRQRERPHPQETESDAPPQEKISDAPPPSVVNKALTGRIRPEWRNGK